ncbi:mechanosensitive ion channel family protein [Peptostreptococcus equinus]|uniref:Mechanosensitive ion channel n=1 Tax=Peptostreptococcus equinus TaxID=3003601 RepID=A0ABY7JSM0_9FIRM|nr:mechanosensitive ion channel domain-containing protein [Peptostreptococcus sp. CBA3647]WAW14927.1 mechanosensitive ion channel [Peptostreptococcus sp. CBA3647]
MNENAVGQTIEKQTDLVGRYFDIINKMLPSIMVAIIVLIVGIIISKVVKKVMSRILDKYKSSIGIVNFLINFVQVIIILMVLMQVMSILGVNTSSFVAIIGAAGFSIGLAFKEILSNFGSCMIILFFKPFQIGDYIVCSDIEGTVSDIHMFCTTLKTVDNKVISLPNFQITNNPVINYTAQDKRRIDFIFNVEYDTDVKKLYEIANRIFNSDTRILISPKPLIGIDSMNNNIIRFIAKPWVKTGDYYNVYYETMEKFKEEFDKNEIKFSRINILNNIK